MAHLLLPGGWSPRLEWGRVPIPLQQASTGSSPPLRVIKGAMHYWSSLVAPHRIPILATDVSAQACKSLAKTSIFPCLVTQKFRGSEVGGRKSWGQSPWSVGKASHQPEASCCTTGSLKAATCLRAKCCTAKSLCPSCHNACSYPGPSTGLDLPPPVGMGVARL